MLARIVILSAFASPFRSGAEACAEDMPAALDGRYDFTIVTARLQRNLPREERLPGNVRLLRVGIGSSIDKWLYPFLATRAVRKLQPDIVHAILESYAGLALIFCAWFAPGIQRVLTCQSTNTRLLLRSMHRVPHAVTAISSVLVDRAKKLGRADVYRIPNGISLQRFLSARQRVHRIDGRILSLGRLEKVKGVDTLITAFREVAAAFPRAELRIVGDGSQRRRLERQASDLIASGRITFVGRIPPGSVADEFAAASIFCGLSQSEALGNVFLEAQAVGCAVVATMTGGIPDIVEDGSTGLLVPPGNAEAAAVAIRHLLGDTAYALHLGEAAAEYARSFDWSAVAQRYARVYDDVLSRTMRGNV